ncbi:hypothetical protein LINPERPRIM_LOCUS37520, partial [Linum perenne]
MNVSRCVSANGRQLDNKRKESEIAKNFPTSSDTCTLVQAHEIH